MSIENVRVQLERSKRYEGKSHWDASVIEGLLLEIDSRQDRIETLEAVLEAAEIMMRYPELKIYVGSATFDPLDKAISAARGG